MPIVFAMPVGSPWNREDLAILVKGKREQHHDILNQIGTHVEMNDDFVHGFATAMAFNDLQQDIITGDDLPQRIIEWATVFGQVLDNLDDLT